MKMTLLTMTILLLIHVIEAKNEDSGGTNNSTSPIDGDAACSNKTKIQKMELGPKMFILTIIITCLIVSIFTFIFLVSLCRTCQESRILKKVEKLIDLIKGTAPLCF